MSHLTNDKFNIFLSQLKETNATLGFYTDFPKCYENVKKISMKLHQLNYLLGKKDINKAIRELWEENPKAFSVLNILIAVRQRDHKKIINDDGMYILIESFFDTVDHVIEFVHETGLDKVFKEKQITNLVDYVFGVEVGLDSNTRKNRSGDIMEDRIARYLEKNGISFQKEVKSKVFPIIHKILGEDTKRFDFVIETPKVTYLVEVNFYSGNGSKLNEVARAYIELATKINSCSGYEFVWITDGIGWKSARGKLEEAFNVIPRIYNLTTLSKFVDEIKTAY